MKENIEALIASGYQARKDHRLDEALRDFSEAVRLSRAANDSSLLANALVGLGQIERDRKNRQAALRCYREAVEILRNHPDRLRFAHTIRHLADILRGDEALDEARSCYGEALEIYRAHSETSPLDLANTLRGFALLQEKLGKNEQAKTLWQEAGALYASMNVTAGVEESARQMAQLDAQ